MFTKVQPGTADGKPTAKAPQHSTHTPPAKTPAPPAKGKVDHKAEIDKMNPEHLHNLVKSAHAGTFGPEAQKHAQQAMQAAPAQGAPGEQGPQDQAGSNFAGMFGGAGAPGGDGDADDQAVPAGQMFGGR